MGWNFELVLSEIHKFCEAHDIKFLVFGGYVRDTINGDYPKDIDIVIFSKEDVVFKKEMIENPEFSACFSGCGSISGSSVRAGFLIPGCLDEVNVDIHWLTEHEFHGTAIDFKCNNLCVRTDEHGKFLEKDVEIIKCGFLTEMIKYLGLAGDYKESCIKDVKTKTITKCCPSLDNPITKNKFFRRAWEMIQRGYHLSEEFMEEFHDDLSSAHCGINDGILNKCNWKGCFYRTKCCRELIRVSGSERYITGELSGKTEPCFLCEDKPITTERYTKSASKK